jgi:hypothetical protein
MAIPHKTETFTELSKVVTFPEPSEDVMDIGRKSRRRKRRS